MAYHPGGWCTHCVGLSIKVTNITESTSDWSCSCNYNYNGCNPHIETIKPPRTKTVISSIGVTNKISSSTFNQIKDSINKEWNLRYSTASSVATVYTSNKVYANIADKIREALDTMRIRDVGGKTGFNWTISNSAGSKISSALMSLIQQYLNTIESFCFCNTVTNSCSCNKHSCACQSKCTCDTRCTCNQKCKCNTVSTCSCHNKYIWLQPWYD